MQKEFPLQEGFTQVRCRDVGTLILTQGDQLSLIVDADEELLPKLVVEVRGDSLVLGLDEDWFGQVEKVISALINDSERKVTYHLTVPDLNQVSISGKMNLACDSFITDDLRLKVSGLGKLDFTHLACSTLETSISGRGEFTAVGRAEHQNIRISGSGEYSAAQLASQTARVVISGQGNATLRVEDSLEITISGLGQVDYIGRPKLRQVITGLGKSKRLIDA